MISPTSQLRLGKLASATLGCVRAYVDRFARVGSGPRVDDPPLQAAANVRPHAAPQPAHGDGHHRLRGHPRRTGCRGGESTHPSRDASAWKRTEAEGCGSSGGRPRASGTEWRFEACEKSILSDALIVFVACSTSYTCFERDVALSAVASILISAAGSFDRR